MSLRVALVLISLAAAVPARAERLVPAFDPGRHVKPPTARYLDGSVGPLMVDADFLERAERWRQAHPAPVAAAATGTSVVGEVVVVQGDDQTIDTDGNTLGLSEKRLAEITRRVIATVGDQFQAITLWTTFNDVANPNAEAYELNVRNDVQGLGPQMRVMDNTRAFGSGGTLRSLLNMKSVGLRAGDTQDAWLRSALPTWGQEGAHRWLVFMLVRDPRTGQPSDMLLGRDCAHYSRYVETQGSVHDGYTWRDNGNGTFTWTEFSKRYSYLDMYGMGLLTADEVPPFFVIENVPGYMRPPCSMYGQSLRPPAQTVQGTRVDITIDDVIAANGERVPGADSVRQDYWREAQVVITKPGETPDSPNPRALIARINQARLWWEAWNLEASQHRLVICTQVTGDCGDARSDVGAITLPTKAPTTGPLPFVVDLTNDGARPATGVKATLELTVGDQPRPAMTKMVGTVAPGASAPQTFNVDLRGVPCGTEIKLKATTQSDFHYSRGRSAFLVGTEDKYSDGFESDSGWTTNPDGNDTSTGATWERGMPESTEILRRVLQPAGAHGGMAAWATGVAAAGKGNRVNLVSGGKATLQSPLYDTAGMHDPVLRYWVTFAGVHADAAGTGLVGSADSKMTVLARAVDMTAQGAMPASDWVPIDELSNRITHGWEQHSVVLPAEVLGKNHFQLRFVAVDGNPDQGGVKAGIDDLEITSNLLACYQNAAGAKGGCQFGAAARGRVPPLAAMLLAVAVIAARRRRAR